MPKKPTRLEVPGDIFRENGLSPEMIEKKDSLIVKIKKNAETVRDCRHQSYVRHNLSDIVMIVFLPFLQTPMSGRK